LTSPHPRSMRPARGYDGIYTHAPQCEPRGALAACEGSDFLGTDSCSKSQ
jgi:hypothetical protein